MTSSSTSSGPRYIAFVAGAVCVLTAIGIGLAARNHLAPTPLESVDIRTGQSPVAGTNNSNCYLSIVRPEGTRIWSGEVDNATCTWRIIDGQPWLYWGDPDSDIQWFQPRELQPGDPGGPGVPAK